MRYLSVCAGIEAASTAWHPLGWTPAAFSEIEHFPSAVLKHRYPNTPNLGDMTKFHEWPELSIDLLVGGTPCQSFSVAGLRKGLDDPRGNLCLTFLAMARRFRPRWVVWENVPGVLSSWSDGPAGAAPAGPRGDLEAARRACVEAGLDLGAGFGAGEFEECDQTSDFDSFLAGLALLGYGFSYRTLDAQFFGVAQRRERVFVVGHLGDWRRAAEVLFEPEGLRGDPPPRRGPRGRPAGTLAEGSLGGGSPTGGDGRESFLVPGTVAPTLGKESHSPTKCSSGQMVGFMVPDVSPCLGESGGNARPGDNVQSAKSLIPIAADREVVGALTRGSNGGAGRNGQDAYAGHVMPVGEGDVPEVVGCLQERDAKGPDSDTKPGHLIPVRTAAAFPWQVGGELKLEMSEELSGTLVKNQTMAVAIQERAVAENPASGPQGSGLSEELAFTMEARKTPQAVAVDMGGGKGQARVSEEVSPILTTSSMGHAVGFTPAIARGRGSDGDGVAPTLTKDAKFGDTQPHVAYGATVKTTGHQGDRVVGEGDVHPALPAGGGNNGGGAGALTQIGMQVRRLTPRECERLQGFPDDHTRIPYRGKPEDECPDGPRYKALGNSMATVVMSWIGRRIAAVDATISK